MARVAGGRPFVFQQDGAPAHTSNATQKYLEDKVGITGFWPKTFWPPSSPDLNPLDYSVWWQMESKVNRVRKNSLDNLRSSIAKEWKALDKNYVCNVCAAFRRRLEKVVAAEGKSFL